MSQIKLYIRVSRVINACTFSSIFYDFQQTSLKEKSYEVLPDCYFSSHTNLTSLVLRIKVGLGLYLRRSRIQEQSRKNLFETCVILHFAFMNAELVVRPELKYVLRFSMQVYHFPL